MAAAKADPSLMRSLALKVAGEGGAWAPIVTRSSARLVPRGTRTVMDSSIGVVHPLGSRAVQESSTSELDVNPRAYYQWLRFTRLHPQQF